jgi:hypothetical protein
MRKLLFIACVASLAACNNAATTETKKDSTATTTAMPEKKPVPSFPYTMEKPWSNWQIGDPQHIVTAMNALKGFETGDIAACIKGFGDSVELHFDGYRAKLSNDSLGKWFTNERNNYTAYKVYMGDFESVISEDKKTEYVTMWYKQVMTDKKGKTDSVSVVDDCKIANGKIVELDEKVQRYPAKK